MISYYNLPATSSILDVGCGKGFMMKDFKDVLPSSKVFGVDISEYCYKHALPEVKSNFKIASCENLPFADKSFDLVVSIATVHNLDLRGVKQSLKEIMRVSRGSAFIKVNGYRTEEEKLKLHDWNLVAKTILHVDDWLDLFDEVGYSGDYSFFST